MRQIIPLLILSLLTTLAACVDSDNEPTAETMPLVVEGWIEDGLAPIVMVTHAVDLTTDTASFDGFVEKWGRVSIYDGDTRYILSGRLNRDYTPSFIFTTSKLKGEPGHTYRLLIETEDATVEAVTTMPEPPEIATVEAVKVADNDTLYTLTAHLADVDPNGYYKFFTHTTELESRYYSAFLGSFAASDYDTTAGWNITRGIHSLYNSDDTFNHYFVSGQHVYVKLCSMEQEIYDFWHVYDSSISLSQNLFFSFSDNCPSNIVGGLGYWAAYGTSRASILIP
jgi:hypothetical protein